ncbi:MAG: 1-acyl-sn-glycerol-3-phosphate acyltransferase [Gemmatimonadetes bacterium]|nr:1-acyl-sn-glycerol-3-phosphate acyltransferase [Gemmatimonadota bacterium]
MTLLVNAWIWTTTVALVIVGTPVVALVWACTAPFDPGHYAAGRAFRLLGVLSVKLNPLWHFEVAGQMVSDPRRPYVAVANHESWADIFLLCHLPWEMKWLSKDAMFKIPCFGWMMRMAGDISIRRGERSSGAQALLAARDRLAKRVSVMVFPEGTRSRDGSMLPFKDGAFRVAIETGTPILPMVVAGTRRAMAKGSMRFARARARLLVLPPIDTAGLSIADVATLRERTRTLIAETRERLLREMEAGG